MSSGQLIDREDGILSPSGLANVGGKITGSRAGHRHQGLRRTRATGAFGHAEPVVVAFSFTVPASCSFFLRRRRRVL